MLFTNSIKVSKPTRVITRKCLSIILLHTTFATQFYSVMGAIESCHHFITLQIDGCIELGDSEKFTNV